MPTFYGKWPTSMKDSPGWQWLSKIGVSTSCHKSVEKVFLWSIFLRDWCIASDTFLFRPFSGSRAPPTTWFRYRRLLWRRRWFIPIQWVRPEEGTEEDESARIQFKQDKAGAAGLETSRAAGGARLFCGSQTLEAAELWGLTFSSFPCWCFCFLKLENHLK